VTALRKGGKRSLKHDPSVDSEINIATGGKPMKCVSKFLPLARIVLMTVLAAALAQAAELPSPDQYFTIKDGHLSRGGQRVRIWGSQGNLSAATYAEIDAEVQRFAELGFNGFRTLWWDIDVDNWSYARGDNSDPDRRDYLFASLRKHGVSVWADMLNSALIRPSHVDLVDDPATREAWLAALGEKPVARPDWIVWDARAEAGYISDIKKLLNHVNQHTGLRWADDPVFYVWEITNEQWWLYRILNSANHLAMPQFFQDELYGQWNAWLKDRYGDDAKLREAWLGSVLPGESLEGASVKLLPLFCPTDAQAEVLGLNVKAFREAQLNYRDFSRQRGADVVEFLTNLLLAHKQRVYAAMRAEGKPDIGISVVPIVYDTGYSFSPQAIYVGGHGDALAVGTYVSQITLDPAQPRYPFKSLLKESPSLSYDNPWVEQNRLVDKPTFIYENMILMPDKYRCEYPYLLVMLASIQDWDVIDFHYYGHPEADLLTAEEPFNKMLRPDSGYSCQGLQFKWDEVLVSSLQAAGEMFKNFAFEAAEKPSIMTVGARTLWDIESVEWGKLPPMFAPTVYRYGLRLKFDPTLDAVAAVEGPVVHGREFLPPEIQPTSQMGLDWHAGILKLDAAKAKAAAGFLPEKVTFSDGIEIDNLTVHVPEDMPYTKPGEDRFVCFGLAAADGQSLAESKRLVLSATSGAFNTGMKVNLEKWPVGNQFGRLHDYVEWGFPMCEQFGSLPVLVARVGFTLKAPVLAGCRYTLKDWHLRTVREGTIAGDGVLTVEPSEPVFIVEFQR